MCPIAGRRGCKACEHPDREWIDQKLLAGASDSSVARELTEKGQPFSHVNIAAHRKNHVVREDPALQLTIRELEQEAAMAPPTVAAVYQVLISQLRMLENAKPSADTAIKAAEAIARITGMRTQQSLLIAYAERAFNQSPAPLEATSVRQLEAS